MAGKRGASNYLTHMNWEQEDEEEDAGIFKQASEDQLQTRKIKVAKRRVVPSGNSDEADGKKNIFSGFSGFTSVKNTNTAAASFSFGCGTKILSGLSQTPSLFTPNTSLASVALANGDSNKKQDKVPANFVQKSSPVAAKSKPVKKPAKKSEYLLTLKKLNISLSNWIKQHVDENPYCILTPILHDYEQHLAELDQTFPEEANTDTDTDGGASAETSESGKDVSKSDDEKQRLGTVKAKMSGEPSNSNTDEEKKTDISNTMTSPTFTFGLQAKPVNKDSAPKSIGIASGLDFEPPAGPGFSFGNKFTTSESSGFSFGFSGASSAQTPSASVSAEVKSEAQEEYEPPEAEVSAIEEEGSLYTKRCKLFYQKNGSWVEKGVGNLHLKKSLDNKAQLLIRADTNLGNILLNIMLASSIPVRRQGKNNVSLMCIPNPPIHHKSNEESKATMLLIRVKTTDEADELFNKVNDIKQ